MKVVGHVEQLRLSRCYQASETLSCTSCHDPHHAPKPAAASEHYRNACLQCHAESACGLDREERTKSPKGDNCAACHMPQVATDIPHVAFTHHRIGIHSETAAEEDDGELADLVPLEDASHLPELDRDRCLGLAYLEFASTQRDNQAFKHYMRRAAEFAGAARRRGLQDAFVDAGLARVYWSDAPGRTVEMAQAAIRTRTRRQASGSTRAVRDRRYGLQAPAMGPGPGSAAATDFAAAAQRGLDLARALRIGPGKRRRSRRRRCVGPPKSIPIEPTSTSSLRGSTRRRAMRSKPRHRQWAEALAAADRRRAGPRQ